MGPPESGEAEFSVFCPGVMEVLSIGKGDLRLTVGCDTPEETEKARKLIEEMLQKGYAIFVETDDGPERVKRFNPKRLTYTIEIPTDEEVAAAPAKGAKKAPARRGRKTTEVPVAGSKATAVGRTAGG